MMEAERDKQIAAAKARTAEARARINVARGNK